ncbi:MAG: FHA domain-containing protein [Pirellulales bacterium]
MAWQTGRYDDAAAIVSSESLRDYLPAKQLALDVAGKMLQRASERLAHGDSVAGWQDLAKADRLGGHADEIAQLRRHYAERTLEEVRRYLAGGQTAPALALLEKLRKRGLTDERARLYQQIAQLVQEGDQAAARGHFVEAVAVLSRAASFAKADVLRDSTMDEMAARLHEQSGRRTAQADDCHRLSAEMHAALAGENWGAVLSAADSLLAIAPQHAAAGQARRRAWRAVGMDVTQAYAGRRPAGIVSLALEKNVDRSGRRSTHRASRNSEVDTVSGNEHPQRALLWVDAVGGFLVCLDDSIVIGQPSPGERIAVPILADLSRRHAAIRRDAGSYVVDPLQRTSVDGREITGPHVLSDNQLIQLGDNVRLRFRKPHALSATARLTLESHHKTQPSADAILLMADSCVLGPNRHCHVRCRDWQRDVVVYRQDNRLYCRADEPLLIDGAPAHGANEIQSGVRVEGEEFSFTWETIL